RPSPRHSPRDVHCRRGWLNLVFSYKLMSMRIRPGVKRRLIFYAKNQKINFLIDSGVLPSLSCCLMRWFCIQEERYRLWPVVISGEFRECFAPHKLSQTASFTEIA